MLGGQGECICYVPITNPAGFKAIKWVSLFYNGAVLTGTRTSLVPASPKSWPAALQSVLARFPFIACHVSPVHAVACLSLRLLCADWHYSSLLTTTI